MSVSKSGCAKCKRKSLMSVTCKCNKTFCFGCRQPEDHECSFDFKLAHQEKLKKENPLVLGEKLEKV
jgi:predicted nucleic acid binding AN1-type Zn finger protein